jgi:hypothetical protein
VKDLAGWAVLAIVCGLIARYAGTNSRKTRRILFFVVVGVGVVVAVYGWVSFVVAFRGAIDQALRSSLHRRPTGDIEFILKTTTSYFGQLGLPLALVIGAALVFGIITLEQTFTRQQLRRRIYPMLAWYFATWITVSTVASLSLELHSYAASEGASTATFYFQPNEWYFLLKIGPAILLLGFVTSAWFDFNSKAFRLLFPAASVLLIFGFGFEHSRHSAPWEHVFLANIWLHCCPR